MTSQLSDSFPQVRVNNLSNNDNDSVSDNVYLKNTNINNTNTNKAKRKTIRQVHLLAYKMADKLGDPINNLTGKPQHFAMYCGYAWKIPESRLFLYLEMVTDAMAKGKSTNPGGLFTELCTEDEAYTKS